MFRPMFVLSALLAATPALANEVYLGGSFHGVDTPFTLEAGERGHDVQFGYRTDRVEALGAIGRPQVYVHGQVSVEGRTSLAAVGLSWKLGDTVYLRPGIGLAVHNDRMPEYDATGRRLDLGSRVLFAPEISVGTRLSKRISLEASWVHVSHATLLSGQNPGMDFIGARAVFAL